MTALVETRSGTVTESPIGRKGVSIGSSVALTTLMLVLFLTFLDNTVVSVVLADVQSSLHAGVSSLQWVVNGYALTFASLMLTFGTLGDLFGRKKVMLAGVAVFCVGSVISAVATDVNMLIAGRVVMGVGAAASEPGTLSFIRHLYEERGGRARALGIWVAVSGLALALGPVIGGALAGVWSWRAIFWFNVTFGLVALVIAALALPENSDPANRKLDVPGAALAACALASLSFAIIAGETAGYRSSWVIGLFVVSALAAVGFVMVEKRVDNPVLDVRFLRRSAFAGSNFVAFSTYFGIFAVFFFVALYLQVVGSRSSYQTALDFVPMAAAMVVASALAGRWVARAGPRVPMTAGCVIAGIGLLLTDVFLVPSSGLSTLGWTLPLAGLGFGIVLVPVTSSALSSIPPEH
ncbi:MAG: MFS transporter, partial [Acidimicrobiales bacterium]